MKQPLFDKEPGGKSPSAAKTLEGETVTVVRDGSLAGTLTVPAAVLQGLPDGGAPKQATRLELKFSYPGAVASTGEVFGE